MERRAGCYEQRFLLAFLAEQYADCGDHLHTTCSDEHADSFHAPTRTDDSVHEYEHVNTYTYAPAYAASADIFTVRFKQYIVPAKYPE